MTSTIPCQPGIPGRLINECTGNMVDIYALQQIKGLSTLALSMPNGEDTAYSWDKSIIFPLKSCTFENRPFKCPAQKNSYLRRYYGNNAWKRPDHVWADQYHAYIPRPVIMGVHGTTTRSRHRNNRRSHSKRKMSRRTLAPTQPAHTAVPTKDISKAVNPTIVSCVEQCASKCADSGGENASSCANKCVAVCTTAAPRHRAIPHAPQYTKTPGKSLAPGDKLLKN